MVERERCGIYEFRQDLVSHPIIVIRLRELTVCFKDAHERQLHRDQRR